MIMEFRSIEIDFDVHQRIELARAGFSDTPNAVLRRLLGIDAPEVEATPIPRTGRNWFDRGVLLPHGTELRMSYRGRTYEGIIDDGQWLVDGRTYSSPSAAAGGCAVTKSGSHPSLNGWNYWQVRRPNDKAPIPISELISESKKSS
jgi:hypothetical protein